MSNFLKCSHCGEVWKTRKQYLEDPDIKIIGYQVNFRDLELGLFLFNHLTCKTTLALKANKFTDLHKGSILKERKTGTDSCPDYCLNKSELGACNTQCECVYVRDVIQIIKNGDDKKK